MIYELEMPCANTAKAYLMCDKETVQYEMMLVGQNHTTSSFYQFI